MTDINTLYYDRFITFIVDSYRQKLKEVKPGHCIKLVGLALDELERLVRSLRGVNELLDVFILSDELEGELFISASKLIELRNDASRAILILIPANSRTAAEDSYGDSTFLVLDVAAMQDCFCATIADEIPARQRNVWNQIRDLIGKNLAVLLSQQAKYLLFVADCGYKAQAWGDGLFLLGMLPDSDLVSRDSERLNRRFLVNLRQCTEVLCDFSLTSADRVAALRMPKATMQKDIMRYLDSTAARDRMALCADVFYHHPELNVALWPADTSDASRPVAVYVDLKPGVDKTKELICDEQGDLLLLFPKGADQESSKAIKRKISLSVHTDPSPKSEVSIAYYEVILVRREGFEEVGSVKKVAVGASRPDPKKISVNIEIDGALDEGQYMLKVRVLDDKKLPLETDCPFWPQAIEDAWQEELAKSPGLERDAFRQANKLRYSNETEVFSIQMDDDDALTVDFGKRGKVSALYQAQIDHDVAMFDEGAAAAAIGSTPGRSNKWTTGTLNSTYQFDLGPGFAYQLSLSNKLIDLEREFYKNPDAVGRVSAELGGNTTEAKFRSIGFESVGGAPRSLTALRAELMGKIQHSTEGETGLVSTFDIFANIDLVRRYLAEYEKWLSSVAAGPQGANVVAVQNADIVWLTVEMPGGSYAQVRLIPPIHPLRLAWMADVCELFANWGEKTKADPQAYRGAWRRKLEALFEGGLALDVAPVALTDGVLRTPYLYSGELTFGWGLFAPAANDGPDVLEAESRQLKSYVVRLLNVSRDRVVDSDINYEAVCGYVERYLHSHPYAEKVVINIFNAGSAQAFANAFVALERLAAGGPDGLTYEVRLFSADVDLIKPGAALGELVNPEFNVSDLAERFSQASSNRLFPKLRYSINSLDDFINSHDDYLAHISFLVNPFPAKLSFAKPDAGGRSFFLNGVICRSVLQPEGGEAVAGWSRYVSCEPMRSPLSPGANVSVGIMGRLHDLAASQMSSLVAESVPATCVSLTEHDKMLVNFVHRASDWVVTFDKNMGPEFYDCPVAEGRAAAPYLLDYVPGQASLFVPSFLTVGQTSEVDAIVASRLAGVGIDPQGGRMGEFIEDIRSVSSSVIFQPASTQCEGSDVLRMVLAKRFLQKNGLLNEAFLVPIALHQGLFDGLPDAGCGVADFLLVNIDPESRDIIFRVLGVECVGELSTDGRRAMSEGLMARCAATEGALLWHFGVAADGKERLDREIKTLELKDILKFYLARACRFGLMDKDVADAYKAVISTLDDGCALIFKHMALVFNKARQEPLSKAESDGLTLFSIGKAMTDGLLKGDDMSPIPEVVSCFEPRRKEAIVSRLYALAKEKEEAQEAERAEAATAQEEPAPDTQAEARQASETDVRKPSPAVRPRSAAPRAAKKKVAAEEKPCGEFVPDIVIGSDKPSPQLALLGKTKADGRSVALDLSRGDVISLFGVQGAGLGNTIGALVEAALGEFHAVGRLAAPLASVIFHYSASMDCAPGFTSMAFPNDDAGQLAKLKAEYGAEPGRIADVVLLTLASQVEERREEYPALDVQPISFAARELNVEDWMFLLGAKGADATYVKQLKQIMKACRRDMTLANIKSGVEADASMPAAHKSLATQRLLSAEDYIDDSASLGGLMRPGRLIIVDLRDEFIEGDEAMGLFAVMLSILASVKEADGKEFNKLMVFDEAHKYMSGPELAGPVASAISEMRHKGVSVIIASQDPMSLPSAIIELSSVVLLHRFTSPAWVERVQRAVIPLQGLLPTDMAQLNPGEAFLWANVSTDESVTRHPIKICVRPSVSKSDGDAIQTAK